MLRLESTLLLRDLKLSHQRRLRFMSSCIWHLVIW